MIIFGAGQIAEREIFSGLEVRFIVDNNAELWGKDLHGIRIKSPSQIDSDSEILVCTSSIREVLEQLRLLNVEKSKIHFSTFLGAMLNAHQLEVYRFDGFISSGLPSNKLRSSGGGIYRVSENQNTDVKVEKIYEGNTHGLISHESNLVFTAQGAGIVTYSTKDKQITSIVELPHALRPHGVQVFDGNYFVACSMGDCVLEVSPGSEIVKRFPLSSKINASKTPHHHCNDLVVTESSIYVSVFSVSGNWKKGLFDGGVIEIDRKTARINPIISDLKMPHSISIIDGDLVLLDSYMGRILGPDLRVIGELNGFTRGLDIDGKLLIVGESKNRNISKLHRGSLLASLDSRITIVDPEASICRSISLPNTISEIHSVVVT